MADNFTIWTTGRISAAYRSIPQDIVRVCNISSTVCQWGLNHFFQAVQKTRDGYSVHCSVIKRHVQPKHMPDADFVSKHCRFLHDPTDAQNRILRRVEDGSGNVSSGAAHIGDRECAALYIVGFEFPLVRAAREIESSSSNLLQSALLSLMDYGHDKSIGEGDCDAHVDIAVQRNLAAFQSRIQ